MGMSDTTTPGASSILDIKAHKYCRDRINLRNTCHPHRMLQGQIHWGYFSFGDLHFAPAFLIALIILKTSLEEKLFKPPHGNHHQKPATNDECQPKRDSIRFRAQYCSSIPAASNIDQAA
jgi:hypothetical protein